MNKTKIEWCDYTWNPITGCRKNCGYCYARKMYKRFNKSFEPKFHYSRIMQPLGQKKPSKIFVCSVSDFWGEGVSQAWRSDVYNIIEACPQHTFQILTKQPQRIEDWDSIPKNVWVGVSITGGEDEWRTHYLKKYKGIKFISFEPLMSEVTTPFVGIDWIIVGAMTGPDAKKYKPQISWVADIEERAVKNGIPLFFKNNLKWEAMNAPLGFVFKRQEFPKPTQPI